MGDNDKYALIIKADLLKWVLKVVVLSAIMGSLILFLVEFFFSEVTQPVIHKDYGSYAEYRMDFFSAFDNRVTQCYYNSFSKHNCKYELKNISNVTEAFILDIQYGYIFSAVFLLYFLFRKMVIIKLE